MRLCEIKEQDEVVKELVRVLKKGHPIMVTGQNRYAMSVSLVSEDVDYAYHVLSKEKPFFMRNSDERYWPILIDCRVAPSSRRQGTV